MHVGRYKNLEGCQYYGPSLMLMLIYTSRQASWRIHVTICLHLT